MMNTKLSLTYCIIILLLGSFSFDTLALPKVRIDHGKNPQGIPRVSIYNETSLTLACYVAIDGYKKKFVLQPFNSSRWYSATSNLYNHSHFSTWCDSLEFHPEYKKYIQ